MNDAEIPIKARSFAFSLRIIELYKILQEQREYVLSKQLLRSGTSIGANIVEAEAAQSRRDFLSKMSIASKEARETLYWLQLLDKSTLITLNFKDYLFEITVIIKILTSIVRTTANSVTQNSKPKTQN